MGHNWFINKIATFSVHVTTVWIVHLPLIYGQTQHCPNQHCSHSMMLFSLWSPSDSESEVLGLNPTCYFTDKMLFHIPPHPLENPQPNCWKSHLYHYRPLHISHYCTYSALMIINNCGSSELHSNIGLLFRVCWILLWM